MPAACSVLRTCRATTLRVVPAAFSACGVYASRLEPTAFSVLRTCSATTLRVVPAACSVLRTCRATTLRVE